MQSEATSNVCISKYACGPFGHSQHMMGGCYSVSCLEGCLTFKGKCKWDIVDTVYWDNAHKEILNQPLLVGLTYHQQ